MSQEEFADLCELDRTYVGGIEGGERNVSLVNLEKLSHFVHASCTVTKVVSCSAAQNPRNSGLCNALIPHVLFFTSRDAQNQMFLGVSLLFQIPITWK